MGLDARLWLEILISAEDRVNYLDTVGQVIPVL